MSPGAFVPGIVGGISVLLGMYGLSVLPVSVTGALLIGVGLALLVAEVFATSYGLLAVTGIASFVIGSLMLVDAPVPALRIGPALVIPVAVALAALTAVLAIRAVRSRHLPKQSGVEAMIGEAGEVIDAITPDHDGRVFIRGELWTAGARQTLPQGATVRVDAVEGLRLRVSALRAYHPEGVPA
jgi:membrane-bound serine protease (ClpP class)